MPDVTEKAAEMIETLRLIEERVSKVVKIDDFVTLFSQEFRNPISSAMNHLQLLREGEFGKLTQRQSEVSVRIAADLETLANLIFVASDLAHGDHAKRRWRPKMVRISELAEQLEAEARVYAKPGGVRLECNISPGIEYVSTEPVRLKIVLRSILLSLMKTAGQGTIKLEIARNEDSAVFVISDAHVVWLEEKAVECGAVGASLSPSYKNSESLRLAERLLELIGGRLTVQPGHGRGISYRILLDGAVQ
jgi:signal transduction histidine kinase